MEKMNCDIVQDLIPSYVDEICSEATRQCVEEHIKECRECRKMVALCRNNSVSAGKLEQKSLDGLKKIKQLDGLKDKVCYGIILFLLIYFLLLLNFGGQYYEIFYALPGIFIACVCLELLAGKGYKAKTSLGKTAYILGAVSVAADGYLIGLMYYLVKIAENDVKTVFGMEVTEFGPFMLRQVSVCFCIQLFSWLYHLYGIMKKDRNGKWLMCLNLTGCFLALQLGQLLFNLVGALDFRQNIVQAIVVNFAIGAVGMAASVVITGIIRKKCYCPLH